VLSTGEGFVGRTPYQPGRRSGDRRPAGASGACVRTVMRPPLPPRWSVLRWRRWVARTATSRSGCGGPRAGRPGDDRCRRGPALGARQRV